MGDTKLLFAIECKNIYQLWYGVKCSTEKTKKGPIIPLFETVKYNDFKLDKEINEFTAILLNIKAFYVESKNFSTDEVWPMMISAGIEKNYDKIISFTNHCFDKFSIFKPYLFEFKTKLDPNKTKRNGHYFTNANLSFVWKTANLVIFEKPLYPKNENSTNYVKMVSIPFNDVEPISYSKRNTQINMQSNLNFSH